MANSQRVVTLYDAPMWDSIAQRQWSLQRCAQCDTVRYPPSPICPDCHCMEADWTPLAGTGTVLSWTVFHRTYFDDHPAPYNTVAVRLDEGPIVVSNIVASTPSSEWIGMRVRITYAQRNGYLLPPVEPA